VEDVVARARKAKQDYQAKITRTPGGCFHSGHEKMNRRPDENDRWFAAAAARTFIPDLILEVTLLRQENEKIKRA